MITTYKKTIIAASILISGTVNSLNAQTLSGGWSHTLFMCDNGNVLNAWGANAFGQLGDGSTTDKSIPTLVNGVAGLRAVAAGYQHSLFLKNDSTVWALGDNTDGQLGNGTNTSTTSPVQVIGITGIKAISGGQAGYHSLALKANGTVWTWGRNSEGQLGDGALISRNTATIVAGLTDVIAIAGGEYHSMALKNDGTVWTWGRNNEGQLGNGTTVNSSTPTPVSGLNGVTAIAGGRYFSIALKNDGTVWTWGQNTYGQLGNGTTTQTTTPIQVLGLTNAKAIQGSAFHCLVIKNDSTMMAWGRNSDGQLGIGSTANSFTAVPINTVSKIVAIAAGTNYSLAKKLDGSLFAWGRNVNGQLGNGTITTTNTPIMVPSPCPLSTSINEANDFNLSSALFYPNPSEGIFMLKNNIDIESLNSELTMYNSLGQKTIIDTKEIIKTGFIDISNQPSGVYYLIMQLGNQTVSHKFVKQ